MNLKPYQIRKKAINMHFSGMKRGTICKKLHLSFKNFDNLIIDYQRKTATRMYLDGISSNNICKTLNINKFLINLWVKEYLQKQSKPKIINKPNGFNPWIDSIIKKNQLCNFKENKKDTKICI